jgi:hypothetical protein
MLAALRSIIRAEFPQFTYCGIYEYTIAATDGKTVDCIKADPTVPLPSLTKVPIRSSVSGEFVTLDATVVGLNCIIAFLNADPSRAICIAIDPFPGALPTARLTDTVVAGPWAGVITSGSTRVNTG